MPYVPFEKEITGPPEEKLFFSSSTYTWQLTKSNKAAKDLFFGFQRDLVVVHLVILIGQYSSVIGGCLYKMITSLKDSIVSNLCKGVAFF